MKLLSLFAGVVVAANNGPSRMTGDDCSALWTFEPAISGSFPCEDSPFDPKKNKVYIKVTPLAEIQKALAKVTPVVVGGPESALMVGEVFTG